MGAQDRHEKQEFRLLDKALELCTYSLNILDNPKNFDPKHNRTINQMEYEARMIYHTIRVANDIYMGKDPLKIRQRLQMQRDVIRLCEELKTDIMIAKGLFHRPAKQIIGWTAKVNEVEADIKAWHKSDKQRAVG